MHASASAQFLAISGLLSVGMLVALLLTFSARTHRIESLVIRRTAELRQASHALKSEAQRFHGVFENAPIGVFIADPRRPSEGRPIRSFSGCWIASPAIWTSAIARMPRKWPRWGGT